MQIKVFVAALNEIDEKTNEVNAFLKTVSNPQVSLTCSPATDRYCVCFYFVVSYTEEAISYRDSAGR